MSVQIHAAKLQALGCFRLIIQKIHQAVGQPLRHDGPNRDTDDNVVPAPSCQPVAAAILAVARIEMKRLKTHPVQPSVRHDVYVAASAAVAPVGPLLAWRKHLITHAPAATTAAPNLDARAIHESVRRIVLVHIAQIGVVVDVPLVVIVIVIVIVVEFLRRRRCR